MMRLLVTAASSVGLILFVALVATRLVRSRRRGLSVRMQIFLALASIVLAFALGLGLLVVDRVEARAKNLALAAAADEARAVAAILQSELDRSGASFATLAADLGHWQVGRSASPVGQMGLELLRPDGTLVFPRDGTSRAREPGAVFVDAKVGSKDRPSGIVRVVKPTIVVEEMLADFAPTVLAISLLLGAAAAVAAAWIGRAIAEPIEALSDFGERVASGQPTAVPARAAGREVARLVRSIDAMRRELEGRPFVETFAADLSHELKNPVAAIRASAEVLQEGALHEPEQAEKFVRRIREATERIERLLAELLRLAQLEAQGAGDLEQLDLVTLVREAVQALPGGQPSEGPAGERRVEIVAEKEPLVRGHRMWISRAISNLAENALIHSRAGSKVQITIGVSRQKAIVRVENEGGVAAHVQKNLFRRFVTTRGDKGGTGLGLAIVRAVAEAHSGQVELVSAGPPRVSFELRLPVA